MPKKIDEAEVKKECPSCGLGVSLESTVCEFCGWDFDEEDEWILQIEKLERDLMLEKQKFEPGSDDDRIESTLHSPNVALREAAKPPPKTAPEPAPKETPPAPKRGHTAETKKPAPASESVIPKLAPTKAASARPPDPIVEKPAPSRPAQSEPVVTRRLEPVVQKPEPPKPIPPKPVVAKAPEPAPREAPSPNVRRVRAVKSAPVQETQEAPTPKKRLVRKVKERS